MPQIGWFEILLIVVVSILVIGPKDFPIMLKKIGSWIGSIKKYFNELQNEVDLYEYESTWLESVDVLDVLQLFAYISHQ